MDSTSERLALKLVVAWNPHVTTHMAGVLATVTIIMGHLLRRSDAACSKRLGRFNEVMNLK